MAIFQCQIQIIKRSEGRSAVAAAAYRAAEKIENEYTGIVEDYSRKNWVEHSEIMLPENAPAEFRNRSVLWNAVEKSEKSKNARLAREVMIALPLETSDLYRNLSKTPLYQMAWWQISIYILHRSAMRQEHR